ncbi:hypothetical protein AOQ84DRAFT_177889 [Glonium stellatum]|uniref:Uncharacterized protein n=1 Tax=Glonium stellatum TaxID=574774 RepID=A0A8E2F7Z5_9PEZI|nr:hypothetical protein AOQ84DRAFT_177889 [Glonium stellatum]
MSPMAPFLWGAIVKEASASHPTLLSLLALHNPQPTVSDQQVITTIHASFFALNTLTNASMAPTGYPPKPSKTGSYAPRTSSTSTSGTTQSIYANSATSSKSNRGYTSKPTTVVIHNGGGQSNGTSSTSAGNSGYYQ